MLESISGEELDKDVSVSWSTFGEEIDRRTRNRGLAEVARRLWASMSNRRAEFEGIRVGINDYISKLKRVSTKHQKSSISCEDLLVFQNRKNSWSHYPAKTHGHDCRRRDAWALKIRNHRH